MMVKPPSTCTPQITSDFYSNDNIVTNYKFTCQDPVTTALWSASNELSLVGVEL